MEQNLYDLMDWAGLEITTLGCTSGNEHTVTEWMDIDSYNRVYRFLKEFIENLTK